MISGRGLIAAHHRVRAADGGGVLPHDGSVLVTARDDTLMFVLAFFFVAVAAYIVGLVGSSNSPTSGMTICTCSSRRHHSHVRHHRRKRHAGDTRCRRCRVLRVVARGDICQDLKISQIVGGTPRRQAWAAITGTVISAFIIAPILTLLNKAYGIGTPAHPGATVLARAAGDDVPPAGRHHLHAPAHAVDTALRGAGVGILAIIVDAIFLAPRNAKFRLLCDAARGGDVSPIHRDHAAAPRRHRVLVVECTTSVARYSPEAAQAAIHRGFLFSSGLVAGEAIMGIVIAGFVVAKLNMPLIPAWACRGSCCWFHSPGCSE